MMYLTKKPDTLGALASSLCLVHCAATPFLFLAQTGSVLSHMTMPSWWKFLDFVFLAISFLAVYRSTQTAKINWVKPALWLSYAFLFIIVINEKLELIPLPETVIYIPTLALIAFHLYNKKYCNCTTNECCTNEG
ncbi:MerC domain-containing protein [Zobellia nedashkovskayae]|uniref:MerC domain-containing protein n=1 Tax=Zobellia nedashkovskayae TaxID=2779510 RepID=UPI00188D461E|nr:MerC domain-containing protein [Zobellia nedashkovskayae]